MSEYKTFVAGIFLASTEGREPMTVDDAAMSLREWREEGWEDIPDGLTPDLLANLWNDCISGGESACEKEDY